MPGPGTIRSAGRARPGRPGGILRAQPPLLDETIRCPRLAAPSLAVALDRAGADFDRRIREHLAFARTGL
ncbi:MAG: hypothetical protein ACJ74U_14985 [Jatrophihabitantaceae bacterium]